MQEYKKSFIKFLVTAKALQFGEFTLKSGRMSPYYFNSASFNSGSLIERLGYFYAATIDELASETDLIFGPAYKGVPLCVSASVAMAKHFNKDVGYFFNRKEIKTHGDKGLLVGKNPTSSSKIVMVDDVISDGATKKEALKMLQALGGVTVGRVVIALDRMESDSTGKSAIASFKKDTGVEVNAIVSIKEVCEHLVDKSFDGTVYLTKERHNSIQNYLKQFAIS